MRRMMFDIVPFRAQPVAGEQGGETIREPVASAPVPEALKHKTGVGTGGREIDELARQLRRAVLVDRDMVDIAGVQSGFTQAISDGMRRKSGPVLDSAEPLLLHRRDEFSIPYEAGGAVGVERIEP